MELNNNLIGIQGILLKCSKRTGDFTKINYTGGNEQQIIYITTELANFLTTKQLLKDKKPVLNCVKDINDIILFLALNTEFKRELPNLEEFSHLTNIIPRLSKCLLVNICFTLGLVEQYCFVIETLPLEATEELLDQARECLRKGKPEEQLHNAFIILKSAINKLSQVELSYKTEETIEDITSISTIILQNLTNVSTDHAHAMKAFKIYQHMGFTLLQFFELLLYVNESNTVLTKLLSSLLSTTCSIIQCVTLNVFCSWAEINYEDQPLQTAIASKAYLVVEKFQKNKIASELVSMLSTIARKPKTIAERILEADVPTMISMVDKVDEHQKLWFSALFNRPIFSDTKVLKCIEKWWQLSDESTVDRMLTLPLPGDSEKRQLIIKCASNLTLEKLSKILTIHFNREGFKWTEDITDQLILLFNRLNGNIAEEELKRIHLLILQNARAFFHHFYVTAFKRSQELVQIFALVKYIATISNIGLESLMQVLDENVPSIENVPNYIQLFSTMLACQYYTWDFMVFHIIVPLLNKYRNSKSTLEEFKCCLQVLKYFKDSKCELSKEVQLFEYSLKYASENRSKSFLEFEALNHEITSLSVDYMWYKIQDLKCLEGKMESFPTIGAELDDPWSNYYKHCFLSTSESSFIGWILPGIDLSDYKEGAVDENFTRLLKILPRCVPAEWNLLLHDLKDKYGFSIIFNALSDIMILLCDFTENQSKHHENNDRLLLALQFCLQNYGKFMLSDPTKLDQQILAINNLCRVLKHIPDVLKPTEGLSLINALPEEGLRSLAKDKEFVSRIILINDKQLCKALAQKVLTSSKPES